MSSSPPSARTKGARTGASYRATRQRAALAFDQPSCNAQDSFRTLHRRAIGTGAVQPSRRNQTPGRTRDTRAAGFSDGTARTTRPRRQDWRTTATKAFCMASRSTQLPLITWLSPCGRCGLPPTIPAIVQIARPDNPADLRIHELRVAQPVHRDVMRVSTGPSLEPSIARTWRTDDRLFAHVRRPRSLRSPSSPRGDAMTDLLFIIVTGVFFAVCVAYARSLDRI